MVPQVVADHLLDSLLSPFPGETGINKHIREDIKFRREQGRDKYGVPLMTHNGRDALRDLYEELLDALLYARQYEIETGFEEDLTTGILSQLHQVVDVIIEKEMGTPGILARRKPEPKPTIHAHNLTIDWGYVHD